jgi:hypothetical protein
MRVLSLNEVVSDKVLSAAGEFQALAMAFKTASHHFATTEMKGKPVVPIVTDARLAVKSVCNSKTPKKHAELVKAARLALTLLCKAVGGKQAVKYVFIKRKSECQGQEYAAYLADECKVAKTTKLIRAMDTSVRTRLNAQMLELRKRRSDKGKLDGLLPGSGMHVRLKQLFVSDGRSLPKDSFKSWTPLNNPYLRGAKATVVENAADGMHFLIPIFPEFRFQVPWSAARQMLQRAPFRDVSLVIEQEFIGHQLKIDDLHCALFRSPYNFSATNQEADTREPPLAHATLTEPDSPTRKSPCPC